MKGIEGKKGPCNKVMGKFSKKIESGKDKQGGRFHDDPTQPVIDHRPPFYGGMTAIGRNETYDKRKDKDRYSYPAVNNKIKGRIGHAFGFYLINSF
jgi:hypothetical protein